MWLHILKFQGFVEKMFQSLPCHETPWTALMEAACNVLSIAYGLQIANAAVLMTNMFGVWPQDELDWFHRIFIEDIFMKQMSGCLIVTVTGSFSDFIRGLACQVLFLAGERYAYIWHVWHDVSEVIESSPLDTEALDWCQVTGKPLAFLCLLPLSWIQCWYPFGKPICRGHSDQAYINHLKGHVSTKNISSRHSQ